MLILTRRIGESLVFGLNGELKITLLTGKGQQVRIGIEAPKEIPVYREELYQRIQRDKLEEERIAVKEKRINHEES